MEKNNPRQTTIPYLESFWQNWRRAHGRPFLTACNFARPPHLRTWCTCSSIDILLVFSLDVLDRVIGRAWTNHAPLWCHGPRSIPQFVLQSPLVWLSVNCGVFPRYCLRNLFSECHLPLKKLIVRFIHRDFSTLWGFSPGRFLGRLAVWTS